MTIPISWREGLSVMLTHHMERLVVFCKVQFGGSSNSIRMHLAGELEGGRHKSSTDHSVQCGLVAGVVPVHLLGTAMVPLRKALNPKLLGVPTMWQPLYGHLLPKFFFKYISCQMEQCLLVYFASPYSTVFIYNWTILLFLSSHLML